MGHVDEWMVYLVDKYGMKPKEASWSPPLVHPDRDPLSYFQEIIRRSNGTWSTDSLLVLIQRHGTRYILYNRGSIREGTIDTMYEDIFFIIDTNTCIEDILSMY